VPSRASPSPGTFPPGLSFLARFPESKIEGIPFFIIHVHAGACHHLVQIPARQLSVTRKVFYSIINIPVHLVGKPLLREFPDQADHFPNVRCGPGSKGGTGHAKPVHILVMFADIALGDVRNAAPCFTAFLDNLVIHIGKIFYEGYVVTPVPQVSCDRVEYNCGTGMTDMTDIIDGNAAGIDADFPVPDRLKCLFFPGERVVEGNRHGTSLFLYIYSHDGNRRGQWPLWKTGDPGQSRLFAASTNQVHILNGLTGRPFDQIIDCRQDNHPFRSFIYGYPDVTKV